MVAKQVIALFITTLLAFSGYTQEIEFKDQTGQVSIVGQTSGLFITNNSDKNYTKFGFALGGEVTFYQVGRHLGGLAVLAGYSGAEELQRTFSSEGGILYYRSTLLTGKITLQPQIYYAFQIKKNKQIGIGYQPQILLHAFMDQSTQGSTTADIPDIQFVQTESSLMAFYEYQVDPLWRIKILAQFGLSPLTLSETSPVVHGLRFQIARQLSFGN